MYSIDLLISTFELLPQLHAAFAEVNSYVNQENRLEVCFSLVKTYDPKKKSLLLIFLVLGIFIIILYVVFFVIFIY